MSKLALGIIETIGLAAAIEAGDTAVKAANVNLIGYELSRGGGMVTVKIEGNVGAVKAAIEAGYMAAEKVSKVWSKQVIPRPHRQIEKLIITKETVGMSMNDEANEIVEVVQRQNQGEEEKALREEQPKKSEEIKVKEEAQLKKEVKEEIVKTKDNVKPNKKPTEICNLCGDPKCPRKKGEPRKLCINFEK